MCAFQLTNNNNNNNKIFINSCKVLVLPKPSPQIDFTEECGSLARAQLWNLWLELCHSFWKLQSQYLLLNALNNGIGWKKKGKCILKWVNQQLLKTLALWKVGEFRRTENYVKDWWFGCAVRLPMHWLSRDWAQGNVSQLNTDSGGRWPRVASQLCHLLLCNLGRWLSVCVCVLSYF